MYAGCNKTALTSQSAIAEALINLMKEKPYARISVSEICKTAGVSRQTFYSLFSSKDNVISYALERQYCFRPEEHDCCRTSMTLEDICHAYSLYITEMSGMLDVLVRNDILYLMQDSLYQTFTAPDCCFCGRSGEEQIYAAAFLASGLTGIARNYVIQGRTSSSERLEEILYSLFSGSYFR